jgi:hypothetical protein
VGSAVLEAVLPPHDGPTVTVPVAMSDDGLSERWGIRSFGPGELRESTRPLLDWLAAAGCSRVAIHFDVDTIDSNEIVLGLGAEPGGLTSAQVRRIVTDIDQAGRSRIHDRGILPPAGNAPAEDSARLPAGLGNRGGLTPAIGRHRSPGIRGPNRRLCRQSRQRPRQCTATDEQGATYPTSASVRGAAPDPCFIYSRIPIASTGRMRSARRVGTDRATRARSAEKPRIAASQPAGA